MSESDAVRIRRLVNEIKYLERELSKELGYTSAISMRRSLQRFADHVQAVKAGKTIKEWKHHNLKEKVK